MTICASGAATSAVPCPTGYWSLRRWRRELNTLPLNQRTEAINKALTALHGYQCSERQRFWLLDRIAREAQPVLEQLRHQVTQQARSAPVQRPVRDYLELLTNLAQNYANVAEREPQNPRPRVRRVAAATHMAVTLHGEQILTWAQLYRPTPAGFWRDLHRLFRWAEQQGVTEHVAPTRFSNRSRPTIGAQCRRIWAFGVAPTDSLPRSQIAVVFQSLGEWLAAEPLATDPERVATGALAIGVSTASEQSPVLGSATSVAMPAGEDRRLFSVQSVVSALQTLAESAAESNRALADPQHLEPQSIDSLRRRFENNPRRAHARQPMDEPVEVKSGLAEIHDTLSYIVDDNADLDDPETPLASPDWTIADVDTPEATDVSSFVTHPGFDRGTGAGQAWEAVSHRRPYASTAPQNLPEVQRAAPETVHWRIADESRSGLRLVCARATAARTSLGQPIIYRPLVPATAKETQWTLAIVRRLSYVAGERVTLGATKWAGALYPADVRRDPVDHNRKRNVEAEPSERALLLPRGPGEADRTTLLLPAYLFRPGEVLEVNVADRTLRVALDQIIDSSMSFVQFTLRNAPPAKRQPQRPEPFDLDRIWEGWSSEREKSE